MLEIPDRIWKAIPGYPKPVKPFRTNCDDILCWQTVRRADRKNVVIKLFEWSIVEESKDELKAVAGLKRLDIPGLVKVYDFGENDDGVYYVMEYWGKDLREIMGAPLREDWIIDIIKQLLGIVSNLHQHKHFHRDIKPENIFINNKHQVKLGDYGLIKSQRVVTQIATIAGTSGYIAPEVLAGKKYDERCDIYSVGIVLLELLTGSRDIPETIPDHLRNLWPVIQKATAKEPEERFASAQEFIASLTSKGSEESKESVDLFRPRPDAELSEEDKDFEETINSNEFAELVESRKRLRKNKLSEPMLLKLDIRPSYMNADWPVAGLGILLDTLMREFDEANKKEAYQKVLEIGTEVCHNLQPGLDDKTLPVYLKVSQILARLNYRLGNYSESAQLFNRCYRYTHHRTGPEAREPVSELVNLADSYLMDNKWEVAYQTYTQAAQLAEKFPEPEAPFYLKYTLLEHILNNLAVGYYRQKQYDMAGKFFQRALEKNKTTTRERQAIKLYNLALSYEAMGNKSAAEPLYKQALEIAEKTMPPDDERLKIIRGGI